MYPMGDIVYNELTGVLANPNPNPNPNPTANPTSNSNSNPNNPSEGAWGQGMMPAGMAGGQDIHDGTAGGMGTAAGAGTGIMFDEEQPWQFGGDFGNDTIWNLLNQFPSQ